MLDYFQDFNAVSAVLVFIYCSLFGSFLNVVVYRMPAERSIVLPGSACGTCGTPLSCLENLPIISYFLLGGHCKTCGAVFSARYACVEALMGCIGVGLLKFLTVGEMAELAPGMRIFYLCYLFGFSCWLAAVFFMDLDHWIILDSVNFSGTLFALACAYFVPFRDDLPLICNEGVTNIISSLLGMAAGLIFFWSIKTVGTYVAKQDALGSGDVKLAMMIGAFLGWQMAVVSYFLSFIIGACLAIVLLVIRVRRSKDPMPLGTFMAIAGLVTVVWGKSILDWLFYV